MASVLSHPAIPLACTSAFGSRVIPRRLCVAGVVACVLPDADVIGFWAGVPYGHLFGHRGFSHSLSFALLAGAIAAAFARRFHARRDVAFAFVFVCTASHGVLDAMTSGGLGIAFFSPFSNHRYFFPWRVLEVAPLGVAAFFSEWGLRVVASELLWIWVPCGVLAYGGAAVRRAGATRPSRRASVAAGAVSLFLSLAALIAFGLSCKVHGEHVRAGFGSTASWDTVDHLKSASVVLALAALGLAVYACMRKAWSTAIPALALALIAVFTIPLLA